MKTNERPGSVRSRVSALAISLAATSLCATAAMPADSPPGWLPNPNNTDGSFLWSMSFGRNDPFSARIQASERDVTLANPGWRSALIGPIDPYASYEALVHTYTPDGGVGHIPAVQFFAEDGAFLGTIGAVGPSGFQDPDGEWVEKRFAFTPANFPSLLTAIALRLILVQDIHETRGTPTTVYFDDVELHRVDGAGPGPNLAPNPSFDLGATPTGSQVTVPLFDESGAGVGVTVLFDEVTVPGATTLRTGNVGPVPPPGTEVATDPVYYEIVTTAEETGDVFLEMHYNLIDPGAISERQEQYLVAYHWQVESRKFQSISNAVRAQHDIVLSSIDNIRSLFAIFLKSFIVVEIDVKPGSDPNCFNLNGRGVVPVAILGSAELDVGAVDLDTLTLDGLTVRVRGNRSPSCSFEDANADSFLDLVCHFEDQPENWTGGLDEVVLAGSLLDGTPIEGTDSICIVP